MDITKVVAMEQSSAIQIVSIAWRRLGERETSISQSASGVPVQIVEVSAAAEEMATGREEMFQTVGITRAYS